MMKKVESMQHPASEGRAKAVVLSAMMLAVTAIAACSSDSDPSPFGPAPDADLNVFGVRGDAELVRFSATDPSKLETVGTVSALGTGESIVGIDFRPTGPTTGDLHAVTSTGRSLILDPETAMATVIQTIAGDGTELTGNRIGVDFNPAANALRIIGDDGKNLRVPTAALTNPAPAMAVNTLVDGVMGYQQGVTAAAYTNAEVGLEGTVLYVIDTENDVLYTQNANLGPLTLVGPLGVDASGVNGYDIYYSEADMANEHYAALTVGAESGLYSIDPATGAATLLGALRGNAYAAVVVARDDDTSPAAQRDVFALAAGDMADQLEPYTLTLGATPTLVDTGDTLTFNGLMDGERVLGLDIRTTSLEEDKDTGYVLTSASRVAAVIDNATDPTVLDLAEAVTLSVPLSGTQFGVDFNPRADLLRILSDTAQNLRVNLQEGRELAGEARAAGFAFVDGTPRVTSTAPQIVATAYRASNPGGGRFQYALDARDSSLARVAVPNDGALVRVGALGVTLPVNGAGAAEQSFDIVPAGSGEIGLAALRTAGATVSTLYTINLDTGAATAVGPIGDAGVVNAITLQIPMP
tara:strand:+ start:1391 stop:3136 length:1746 start_codon:yes stop_codon:yes gene_type:complete